MEKTVYNTARWRELPREACRVHELFGDAAGPCGGLVHRHHVDPHDEGSRTVECCATHHPQLHMVLRRLSKWRSCPHRHRTRESREACERRLNQAA